MFWRLPRLLSLAIAAAAGVSVALSGCGRPEGDPLRMDVETAFSWGETRMRGDFHAEPLQSPLFRGWVPECDDSSGVATPVLPKSQELLDIRLDSVDDRSGVPSTADDLPSSVLCVGTEDAIVATDAGGFIGVGPHLDGVVNSPSAGPKAAPTRIVHPTMSATGLVGAGFRGVNAIGGTEDHLAAPMGSSTAKLNIQMVGGVGNTCAELFEAPDGTIYGGDTDPNSTYWSDRLATRVGVAPHIVQPVPDEVDRRDTQIDWTICEVPPTPATPTETPHAAASIRTRGDDEASLVQPFGLALSQASQ